MSLTSPPFPLSTIVERGSGGEDPQRGSALELHPANGITVRREDAVQLRARVSSSCVHEFDWARDAYLVTTPHQLECPARCFEACVGGGDRRSRYRRGFVRRANLERDPVREILPLGPGAIGLVAGLGPSGSVAAAVEEVPRHDDRREPEIVARAEREVGTLEPVIQRHGHAGEERRGRRTAG